MIKISTVIVTRNRKESLYRTLQALDNQTCKLQEVIIVDSSDEELSEAELSSTFDKLNIKYITSVPSVCVQRNIGICKSTSDYIFICDDDVEPEPGYVSALSNYIESNSSAIAVSGLILQTDENGNWISQFPPKSTVNLLFSLIFQLSVWGEVDEKVLKSVWIKPVIRFYKKRGNGFSFAGWPIITDFSDPVFETNIYGLGASIVKKEWLINNPFDEVLDQYGIGDNYGICISFPVKIKVLTNLSVFHHRVTENRLDSSTAYYRRVLALHYFLKKSNKFNYINTFWLLWSLTGNIILFLKKRQYRSFRAALKSMLTIVAFNNPYWKASKKNTKIVCPELN